jgi:hypothetical protein
MSGWISVLTRDTEGTLAASLFILTPIDYKAGSLPAETVLPDVRKALNDRPDALQLADDQEVIAGVRVFPLGCHTPGSQGVLVRTVSEPPRDAILKACFEDITDGQVPKDQLQLAEHLLENNRSIHVLPTNQFRKKCKNMWFPQ